MSTSANTSTKPTHTSARRRAEPPADSPWLSPKEAAAYLGIGVDRIYEAINKRELRCVKLGYGTIRLKREWVDKWAESFGR
jgi:excisionase family DNA binding protein